MLGWGADDVTMAIWLLSCRAFKTAIGGATLQRQHFTCRPDYLRGNWPLDGGAYVTRLSRLQAGAKGSLVTKSSMTPVSELATVCPD